MDPTNPGSEDFHDDARASADGGPLQPSRTEPAAASSSAPDSPSQGPVRVVQLVTGDYLLTVNPVDGSEIEPCPPGRLPARPQRHGADERAELRRAAAPPPPARPVGPELPLVERDEERERLTRLLSRGRSVRLTGPAGSGRTALLDAVATNVEGLAPDGVVRLSGYHRTPADLLYELFAAVHHAPLNRPDRAGILAAVHEIGAVVVLDDLEFGGSALDELLDATPECAFLLAATPDVAAPSPDSHLEEVFLGGLDRTGCLELLERSVERPLTDEEADWAADLWFESEGLPLRFVQAGALLRHRDRTGADPAAVDEFGVFAERPYVADAAGGPEETGGDVKPPLPSLAVSAAPVGVLASRLSDVARDTLSFALALGGEVPHQAHLPALAGDTHADAAVGELLASGLITAVGAHYRLAAGVADQLLAEGYGTDSAARAHSAAQHYAWWAGHPSVAPERAAAEADAILAAMAVLVADGEAGHPAAAVLLARTAAPAFAAACHWSAWERCLRHGQAAARMSGEVGEEAYFHHELGVLALCTGNLDRARAELEASIGLRGVMADKRGAVAGRRALALVADRSGLAMGMRGVPGVPPLPPLPGEDGPAPAAEEIPAARSEQSLTPPYAVPAARSHDSGATTVVGRFGADSGKAGPVGASASGPVAQSGPGRPAHREPWARRLMAGRARRNLIAAGAGALLAGVLGTVVTLGAASGGPNHKPSDQVKPDQSASQQDGDNTLNADQPAPGATGRPQAPGGTGKPGQSQSPGATPSSPGASGSTSPSPSDSGSPSGTPSSSSGPTKSPTRSPGGGDPTPPTQKPTPTKTQEPTKDPEPPTQNPTPPSSPAGSSNSASGPAPGGSGSGSAPAV
ncbi:ATP-binding protein [Streptomyces syringium]|uniref:ATP-binding protein n=1 Tax=Streptomyces syringium TaxID=76729 RepID=UPI003669E7DF